MKMNKKISIEILVIMLILLVAFAILIPKPPVKKEFVEQRFSEFEVQYEEKQALGYDVTEAGALTRQAKRYYDKGEYVKANRLLNEAFKALKKAEIPIPLKEHRLPSALSHEYEKYYKDANNWLDEKLIEWAPTEYKQMKFVASHLHIAADTAEFHVSNSDEDIKFLDMLDELGINVVGVTMRAPEHYSKSDLERYDKLFKEIRKREMALKIWYDDGIKGQSGEEYHELAYRATEYIIKRWHPDYYSIIHEPTVRERRYGFKMSKEVWLEHVERISDLAKHLDPNVTTIATVCNNERDVELVDYFVKIPSLDIVGFDIYYVWGIDEDSAEGDIIGKKVDLIHSHGKRVWIEETWSSLQWSGRKRSPGFDDPERAWWDARWMRVITYYAQTHDIEAVEPFFTDRFILYPGYNPYANKQRFINDYKIALREGNRTKIFYAFKEVIEEVKGNLDV